MGNERRNCLCKIKTCYHYSLSRLSILLIEVGLFVVFGSREQIGIARALHSSPSNGLLAPNWRHIEAHSEEVSRCQRMCGNLSLFFSHPKGSVQNNNIFR